MNSIVGRQNPGRGGVDVAELLEAVSELSHQPLKIAIWSETLLALILGVHLQVLSHSQDCL